MSKRSLPTSYSAASVVIGPKEINGKLIDFFACECLNGTRTAVSKDGTIIIPLDAAPVAAPAPAPVPAPVPAPAAVPAFAPSTTRKFRSSTCLDHLLLLSKKTPPLTLGVHSHLFD
jgi:hypothetical protein